jgi:hypothetical protein
VSRLRKEVAMLPHLPTSPARLDVIPASWTDHQLVVLVLAVFFLVIALRFMKRALAPIGALVQAVAAAGLVAVSVGAALVLLAAAAFTTH